MTLKVFLNFHHHVSIHAPFGTTNFYIFYVNCSQVLILHFDYLELYFALCFPCEPMSPQEVASLRHGVEN